MTTTIVYEEPEKLSDPSPPSTSPSSAHSQLSLGSGAKIRRHASEESLKIAISREEAESTSMSKFKQNGLSTQLNLRLARRKSQDSTGNHQPQNVQLNTQGQQNDDSHSQSQHLNHNHFHPHFHNHLHHHQQQHAQPTKPKPQRYSRADLQNRMQRMLGAAATVSSSQKAKQAHRPRRSESEKAVPTHGKQQQHQMGSTFKIQDPSKMFLGNASLQASYVNIVGAGRKPVNERVAHSTHDHSPMAVTSAGKNRESSTSPGHRPDHYSTHHHRRGSYEEKMPPATATSNPYRMFLQQTQHLNKSSHARGHSRKTSDHTTKNDHQPHHQTNGPHHSRSRSTSSDRAERVISNKNPYHVFLEHSSHVLSNPMSMTTTTTPPSSSTNHDYTSDSELVTGFRARMGTSSPERGRNRVRFASPVAGNSGSSPPRKGHGRGSSRGHHGDSAGTAYRKSKK